MIVGVPKEIKTREYRVGMVPAGVRALTSAGHTVLVETNAGVGSGIPDSEYQRVGAQIIASADEVWKRGMGMASQIWYGGGGPPSYAWVRLGSDGRANVVTAMQDIGTGTRTAVAMVAAEELGLPLDHVEVQIGDSARGPFASISGGSGWIVYHSQVCGVGASNLSWLERDIAIAVGGNVRLARSVASVAAKNPTFANPHRVLLKGGVIAADWRDDDGKGPEECERRLRADGIDFDEDGTADQKARSGYEELQARLAEIHNDAAGMPAAA